VKKALVAAQQSSVEVNLTATSRPVLTKAQIDATTLTVSYTPGYDPADGTKIAPTTFAFTDNTLIRTTYYDAPTNPPGNQVTLGVGTLDPQHEYSLFATYAEPGIASPSKTNLLTVVPVTTMVSGANLDADDGTKVIVSWNAVSGYGGYAAYLRSESGEVQTVATSETTTTFVVSSDDSLFSASVRVTANNGTSLGADSAAYAINAETATITRLTYRGEGFFAITTGVGATFIDHPAAFVVGDDARLWMCWWDGTASHWANHGKPAEGVAIAAAVGATSDGGVGHVFVVGDDGHLWRNSWDGSAWVWADQGTPSDQSSVRSAVGVSSSGAQASTFVLSNDGTLWQSCLDGSTWSWVSWGAPPDEVSVTTAVGVFSPPSSSPQTNWIFVIGNDNSIWARWTASSGWDDIGMPYGSTKSPVGVSGTDTDPYAFIIDGANFLWLLRRNQNGLPSDWEWVCVTTPEFASGIGAVALAGIPSAICKGKDEALWIYASDIPHGPGVSSSKGTPPGVSIAASVGVTANANQIADVFVIGSDGNLWLNEGDAWICLNQPSSYPVSVEMATNESLSYEVVLKRPGQPDLAITTATGSCVFPLDAPLEGDGNTVSARSVATVGGSTAYGPSSPTYTLLADAPVWVMIANNASLLSLSWTALAKACGYVVNLTGTTDGDMPVGDVTSVDAPLPSMTTSYPTTVFATASDGVVIGPRSDVRYPLLVAPTGVMLGYTGAALRLSWSSSSEQGVTGYALALDGSDDSSETSTATQSPSSFQSNLEADVVYTARVRASGPETLGPSSQTATGPYRTTLRYAYDSLGRMTAVDWQNSFSEAYAFDSAGNITSASYPVPTGPDSKE
jgi:YD repeat-containing protein